MNTITSKPVIPAKKTNYGTGCSDLYHHMNTATICPNLGLISEMPTYHHMNTVSKPHTCLATRVSGPKWTFVTTGILILSSQLPFHIFCIEYWINVWLTEFWQPSGSQQWQNTSCKWWLFKHSKIFLKQLPVVVGGNDKAMQPLLSPKVISETEVLNSVDNFQQGSFSEIGTYYEGNTLWLFR